MTHGPLGHIVGRFDAGVVDATDVGQLKSTYNQSWQYGLNPLYLNYLDVENNGVVDTQDVGQFKLRFNHNVF